MNKRERMYKQIEKHGQDLLRIFPNALETDAIKLCKKLHTLEMQARRLTMILCDGVASAERVAADAKLAKIHDKVTQLLGVECRWRHIFINYDARGYAIKLSGDFSGSRGIYKDWGGYGIIAPDFTGD